MGKSISTRALLKFSFLVELSAKVAAHMFWIGEVGHQQRRLKKEDCRFHTDEDIEKAMGMIEEQRRENVYSHTGCSDDCK